MNNISKTIAFSALVGVMSTASFAEIYIWDGTSNQPTVITEADVKTKYNEYTIVETPDVTTFSVEKVQPTQIITIDKIEPSKNYIVYKKQ